MPVHVSIHDVTPAFEPQLRHALALASRFGARPALLVVPNFHRAWPLEKSPDFCRYLRELAEQGHEILLHGFHHAALPRRTRPVGLRGAVERAFAQRVVSAGEAEFAELTPAEAESLLVEGERVLERVGLWPRGFVAPAWTMPSFMNRLLAARGYRYTEDHLRVYDPLSSRSRPSVLLNFATRTRLRMLSTIGYCRIAKRAFCWLPGRIAIHPHDVESRVLRGELGLLLHAARMDLVPSGRELLGPQAERSAA